MEKTPTPQNQTEAKKSKNYLYRMIPADMQGNVLHPLNSLKDTNPKLYLFGARFHLAPN